MRTLLLSLSAIVLFIILMLLPLFATSRIQPIDVSQYKMGPPNPTATIVRTSGNLAVYSDGTVGNIIKR
jgi:hypothetical protein